MNFGLLFRGAKFFHNGYLAHFLSHSDNQNLGTLGSSQSKLIPEFFELLSRGPVIPCVDMHQSFIGTLVTWFSTTSLRFSIVLAFFPFTALPEY